MIVRVEDEEARLVSKRYSKKEGTTHNDKNQGGEERDTERRCL